MKKLFVIALSVGMSLAGFAQEGKSQEEEGFNKFSTKRIHDSDIMWKKSVLRALDLREKQNQPLFSSGREITKTIIDAVKEGSLVAYTSDSLDGGDRYSVEEFLKKIEIPSEEAELSEEDLAFMDNEEDDWGDDDGGGSPAVSGPEYFFPKDLYQMQIKEDLIFDKQRSRMYYDIISISMFIPADHPDNIKGIEIPIATFSYKEMSTNVFEDNPDAIWYNPYNDAEHRNLADAFELRLFSSYIIKVSNPNDEYLVDIYGGDPKVGIMASQWKAFELLEFEHNLWEF